MESRSDDTWLDDLFDVPPAEFVATRNALAKRLRKEGRKADADAVKKLTKPPIPVWLVDQWAKKHGALMMRLLAVLDDMRSAQAGAGLDRERLLAARLEERTALAALAKVAPALLAGAGIAASQATIDRALKTVRAAAASPDHRADLEAGRLTQEVSDSGFDGLAAALMPSVDVASVQKRRDATARSRAQRPARPPLSPSPKTLQRKDANQAETNLMALGPPAPEETGPPAARYEDKTHEAASPHRAVADDAKRRAKAQEAMRQAEAEAAKLRAEAEEAERRAALAARRAELGARLETIDREVSRLEAEVRERAAALAGSERRLDDIRRAQMKAREAFDALGE